MLNEPSSLVVAERVVLVRVSVTVTVTPAAGSPEGVTTVPRTEPVVACAPAVIGIANIRTKSPASRLNFERKELILLFIFDPRFLRMSGIIRPGSDDLISLWKNCGKSAGMERGEKFRLSLYCRESNVAPISTQ
jgi:hypothetical protein